MIQRPSKVGALNAVDPWTMGEAGEERCKKIYKHHIKRIRRTLEKREAQREISAH